LLSDVFLQLPTEDRQAIFSKASQELGRSVSVLEKDVWVCWVLKKLFALPGVPRMSFKGGTSLSKVFDVIARFSEDVDVTLDRTELAPDIDPFAEFKESNTRRKKAIEQLDQRLIEYVNETMKPYFDSCLLDELDDDYKATEFDETRTELRIPYPSVIPRPSEYLVETIRLELGGRNKVEPADDAEISPYIKEIVPGLVYPVANVSVLSPNRTFWEKATLIHLACNKANARPDASRWSRHWYDLAELANSSIGEAAIADHELLADVILQKSVLYRDSHADYESCLVGKFKLVPSKKLWQSLERDFNQMREAGMFWRDPPQFDELMAQINTLEGRMNSALRL